MQWRICLRFGVLLLMLAAVVWPASCGMVKEKIGVIFVIHGGEDTNQPQYMWDAAVQMFAYDPNHPVHKIVVWNREQWGMVTDSEFAVKFLRKYDFEYPRIGDVDPGQSISDAQLAAMKAELDRNTEGFTFEVDWAGWMCGDHVDHFPYPRFIYYPPATTSGTDNVTYCGELEENGPWEGCVPERYNVDGPVERLLKKGVSRIIMIDLTVGGVRFAKSYDVLEMTKRAIDNWNEEEGASVPYPLWINDYTGLMERSYPTVPAGWTGTLGAPETDPSVPLEGSPNPVAEDPLLATLHVEGIETVLSDTVADADTGVILLNHALHDYDEYFDPKINDTLIINENIKSQLLERRPDMQPENIIGAYMGIKEENPENGLVERTREMRGEDLGHAWLYESSKQLPGDEWGYRYWDALEYLKGRGVKHIVIAFPQIVIDTVLSLVEIHNQIGKEIGKKTWYKWDEGDFEFYPGVGHPFAEYWGNWVNIDCGGTPCCFTMGGCGDGGAYPPPRQAPLDRKRDDMDPSLAYQVSEYGHLGYNPAAGAPSSEGPVQDQYTGTWALWRPPNADPRVGALLAQYVLDAARGTYD